MVIGLAVGVISGYFGKRVDAVLMRFTDGMIALPLLPLLIVLGAIDLTKLGFSAEFAPSGAVVSTWLASDHFDPVKDSTLPLTGFGAGSTAADGGVSYSGCGLTLPQQAWNDIADTNRDGDPVQVVVVHESSQRFVFEGFG